MADRSTFTMIPELRRGPLILRQVGVDHEDQAGITRIAHDGQRLNALTEAGSEDNPPEQSAPVHVMLLPRIALITNQATRAGLLTLQGVALADGNMVLLAGQTDPTQNGPYIVHANNSDGTVRAWTRATLPIFPGQLNFVQAGTYSGKLFSLLNVGSIVLGTTALSYGQIPLGESDGCLVAPCAEIGTQNNGYYGGVNQSWMVIDGANPPLMPVLRLIDQTDGSIKTVRVNGGVLQVV